MTLLHSAAGALGHTRSRLSLYFPGVLAAFTVAAAATFLSEHHGGPTMLYALLLGIAFNFLSKEGQCPAGIAFTARGVLRLGVALLGLRISIDQILGLGLTPIAMVTTAVAATMASGLVFAWWFRRGWAFGLLTGGAVAICGASAALALAAVLPRAHMNERDTLFTVVAVTLLSTVAMIFYPVIIGGLGLDAEQAGQFLGATIHDVAQVVGAGYSMSETTGDTATYVKLLRVSLLAPVILVLSLALRGRDGEGGDAPKALLPTFVIAFGLLVVARSLGLVPEAIQQPLIDLSRWCLVAAIAAIGMKTSLGTMVKLGPAHAGVVVGETLFLALLVLVMILVV